MQVVIVPQLASLKDRSLPARGEPFENVSENQVLADFRAAFSGKDSLLRLQNSIAGFPGQPGDVYGAYSGQFEVAFRRLELNRNRNLYHILVHTLEELLKKTSSSDALFAIMCVTPPAVDQTVSELSLVLRLNAIGNSPEQAELRWRLGLGHVHEALLAASVLLLQHLAKTGVEASRVQ